MCALRLHGQGNLASGQKATTTYEITPDTLRKIIVDHITNVAEGDLLNPKLVNIDLGTDEETTTTNEEDNFFETYSEQNSEGQTVQDKLKNNYTPYTTSQQESTTTESKSSYTPYSSLTQEKTRMN